MDQMWKYLESMYEFPVPAIKIIPTLWPKAKAITSKTVDSGSTKLIY